MSFVTVQARPVGQSLLTTVSKTLSANNTTATVQLWRVTGMVHIKKLYAVVTTTIGANHTGAYLRLNDQTAQADISLSTGGSTLSGLAVGTIINKDSLAGSDVLTVASNATGIVYETSTPGVSIFQDFAVIKKTGANTDIEYVYTTTDTPTSGALQFFAEYVPLSTDGALTAL